MHKDFQPVSGLELDAEYLRDFASRVDVMAPSISGIWSAVYPILGGLEVGKDVQFELALRSSLQKLIAMLSYETCASLDNYHRIRTEGKIRMNYKFSLLM